MEQIIAELAAKFPVVMAICAGIGIFRIVFKPFVALVKMYVAATETKKDDEAVAKVEASKFWKAVLWIVDYLLSIKLPSKK